VIRPATVVSSANLIMVLESCVATQSWVNMEYNGGLSTHPYGAPVLRVRAVEVMLPTITTWGRPIRKSRIQLQREGFRPRVLSLVMRG
jgi:N-formylglutamate amidohydrolase